LLGLGLGTRLFVKVPRPGDSEWTFSSFRFSSQAATSYYQSNYSKVEAILLSAFCPRTQLANLPAYLTLTLLIAERQAGKL